MAKELSQREFAAMGGKARRDTLSKEQRQASARKASNARWTRWRAEHQKTQPAK